MEEEKKDLKVKKLEVKNVMMIQEVNIKPKNELVIIAGANRAGKTSVIKSLEISLKGKKSMAGITKIVHEGEEEADIIADFDDIVIKRHFTEDGREAVKVLKKDGTSISRPQEVLDAMYSKMLNIEDFMMMRPKEQKELLINSLNLDIDLPKLEEERERIYELRTAKGRDRDNAKAHLEKMEPPESWEDMPEVEISFGNLVQELEKRKDHNNQIEVANRDAQEAGADIRSIDDRIQDLKNQILEFENKKADLKLLKDEKEKWLKETNKMNEDEIRDKIGKVEEQNIRIRESNKYREYHKNVAVLNGEYDGYTKNIIGIDKTIGASLARAKMPIPGLEVYAEGLGISGIPFEQIAESDKRKAAIGIAMGIEPQPPIKVLIIKDGRSLDTESWEVVREMAKEHGYQIWIQYVDESGEIGFVIKEGRVDKIND